MNQNDVLAVKAASFDQVLAVVRAYLPPDSTMTPQQFVRRVIEAMDTPEICRALGITHEKA